MTSEEADFIGGMNMCDEISNEAYKKIMCHCEEQGIGHWDFVQGEYYFCTECKRLTKVEKCLGEIIYDYCPKCGAKME